MSPEQIMVALIVVLALIVAIAALLVLSGWQPTVGIGS